MNNYIKYTLTQYIESLDFTTIMMCEHEFLDTTLYDFDKAVKDHIDAHLNYTIKSLYDCNKNFYNAIGINSNKALMDKLRSNDVQLELEIFFMNTACKDIHKNFYKIPDDITYEEYLNMLPYSYYGYYVNIKKLVRYEIGFYDETPYMSISNNRFELSDLDDSIEGYKLGDYVEFYGENEIGKGYITVAPEKKSKFDSRLYEVTWYDENDEYNSYWIDEYPKIHYDDIIRVISRGHYDIVKRAVIDEDHNYTKEYIEKIKKLIFK